MRCQVCEKRPATVHMTQLIQNKFQAAIHICTECARKHANGVIQIKAQISSGPAAEAGGVAVQGLRCGECDATFEDFGETKRLGCPNDYQVFREALVPLLEKYHGSSLYLGSIPPGTSPDVCRRVEIRRLERVLEDAVRLEDFEKAATLRDRLRPLRGTESPDDTAEESPDESP